MVSLLFFPVFVGSVFGSECLGTALVWTSTSRHLWWNVHMCERLSLAGSCGLSANTHYVTCAFPLFYIKDGGRRLNLQSTYRSKPNQKPISWSWLGSDCTFQSLIFCLKCHFLQQVCRSVCCTSLPLPISKTKCSPFCFLKPGSTSSKLRNELYIILHITLFLHNYCAILHKHYTILSYAV